MKPEDIHDVIAWMRLAKEEVGLYAEAAADALELLLPIVEELQEFDNSLMPEEFDQRLVDYLNTLIERAREALK